MYFLEYYVTKLLLGYLSKQCKLGKLKIKKKKVCIKLRNIIMNITDHQTK